MPEPRLNPETLATLKACSGPEDPGFLREVIEAYLADAEARLRSAREAQRAGDASALAGIAHTLKGSSLNVGADALAVLLQAIEREARHGSLPDAARLRDAEAEFARVRAALSDLLA